MDEAEEVVQHDGLRGLLVPVAVLQDLDAALVVGVDGEADVPVGPGQGVLQQVHLVQSAVHLNASPQPLHVLLGRLHGDHLVPHGGGQQAVVADVGADVDHRRLGEPLQGQLVQLGDLWLPHALRRQGCRDVDVVLLRVHADVEPGRRGRQRAVDPGVGGAGAVEVHEIEVGGEVEVSGRDVEELALAQLAVRMVAGRGEEEVGEALRLLPVRFGVAERVAPQHQHQRQQHAHHQTCSSRRGFIV